MAELSIEDWSDRQVGRRGQLGRLFLELMFPPSQWSKRTRYASLGAALFLLCTGALIALAWSSALRAREQLVVSLDDLSMRGELVYVEDLLEVLEGGDPETLEWLQVAGGFPEVGYGTEPTLAAKRGYRSAREKYFEKFDDYDDEPQWEELFEPGSEAWSAYYWNESIVRSLFDFQPSREQVTPDELEAYASFLGANGEVFEHALLVADRHAPDWRAALESSIARGPVSPLNPMYPQSRGVVSGYLQCVESFSYGAVLAAFEGRSEAAVELLDLAFKAAWLFENQPYESGYVEGCVGEFRALGALKTCLAYLPPSTDLTGIERELRRRDAHAEALYALRGEVAFGNSAYRHLRTLSSAQIKAVGKWSFTSRLPFVWERNLDMDQVRYLDLMEQTIQESGKLVYDNGQGLKRGIDEALDSEQAILSPWLIGNGGDLNLITHEKVSLRHLALAGMEAHKNGADAARKLVTSLTDPFSGRPYRSRLEEDGTLLLWSVGADGTDNDARPDEEGFLNRDIVWRYHPHGGVGD